RARSIATLPARGRACAARSWSWASLPSCPLSVRSACWPGHAGKTFRRHSGMASNNGTPDERSSTSTSRSLLEQLHANDPSAWDRLVTLYAPLVWHWCRRMNLPSQDVADVFQEVFQAVAAHMGAFHKERRGDTFRGWLRVITRNKVHDYFRRRQREPEAVGGT